MPQALIPSLSSRDSEILDALVHRVRVFTLQQLGRVWWSRTAAPEQNAKRRLAELERYGLVKLYSALVHPELPLEIPVGQWRPGEEAPDFGVLSYRLKSRWTEPPQQVNCAVATKLAGQHFGGSGGRLPRETEQTHDVHLAAVFLLYRSRHPHLVRRWVSEAAILRSRENTLEKLPDAILDLDEGPLVIEFGGSYAKEKLAGFHAYCSYNGLAYEIW